MAREDPFDRKGIVLPAERCREEVVSFPVPGGEARGILSLPAAEAGAAGGGGFGFRGGVVFSHGWSGDRCGPAGLLRFLARRLAGSGYACLRFDFSGRGESDGPGLSTSLATMGDDLVAAVGDFRRRTGIADPVVCGLCSGGNVAIGSLDRLPGLRGLLLLSVYPFSDGDRFGREVHRTWHFLRIYLRKACRGDTWRRLLQGEVGLRNVLAVLFGHWGSRRRDAARETGRRGGAPGRSARAALRESRGRGGGPPPEDHLRKLRPGLPALMIYGSGDPDAAAAQAYFGGYASAHGLPVKLRVVAQANHNFSSREWRERLADLSLGFLASPEEGCRRT